MTTSVGIGRGEDKKKTNGRGEKERKKKKQKGRGTSRGARENVRNSEKSKKNNKQGRKRRQKRQKREANKPIKLFVLMEIRAEGAKKLGWENQKIPKKPGIISENQKNRVSINRVSYREKKKTMVVG